MCFRPAAITEKRCSKCGTANKIEVTTCAQCGEPLAVAPGMGVPGTPSAPGAPGAPATPGTTPITPAPPKAPKTPRI